MTRMTDTEAKRVLMQLHPGPQEGQDPCDICLAMRHCFAALDDRAALVEAFGPKEEGRSYVADVARRHMRDEE